MKPLCIDLFAGLGGWAEGFLAEGWRVVGFDIERHRYPSRLLPPADGNKSCDVKLGAAGIGLPTSERSFNYSNECKLRAAPLTGAWDEYPAQLVLQDVLTLHGSQFRTADCIVASPPCQAYSYRAMPWKRAKALPPPSNELFDACFRIQREACEAAGRYIPLVAENVKGAQPWVGQAKCRYGSFYLWGDVDMVNGNLVAGLGPLASRVPFHAPNRRPKQPGRNFHFPEKYGIPSPSFHGADHEESVARVIAVKARKDGAGGYGGNFGWDDTPLRLGNSKSDSRKAASAQIAKIPFELACWIAQCFKPVELRRAG